jgi:phosphatidylinositol-3-phosphatase
VIWILMENHSFNEIIGNSAAPYINQLASHCGLATNYFAVSHPSLPNYIALTSGSTQGITDDNPPSSHRLNVPSIFSQLEGSPSRWRSLEESMPSNCDRTDSGEYAVRHNPAADYVNLPDCNVFDVPFSSPNDFSARFTFVTPNLIDDMHDGTVQQGDTFLSNFVPTILSSPEYQAGKTILYITWDEDDGTQSNQVATLVIAPSVKPGTRSAMLFNHYSLLRTTEEQLGLGLLGNAANATSMRSAFGI